MPFKYVDDYNFYMRDYMKRRRKSKRGVNPTKRELQYLQIFQEIRKIYFLNLQNKNIELFLASKKDWKEITKAYSDGANTTGGLCRWNKEQTVIFYPFFRKLPVAIVKSIFIHELIHAEQRRGHDRAFMHRMFGISEQCRKTKQFVLQSCLLSEIVRNSKE